MENLVCEAGYRTLSFIEQLGNMAMFAVETLGAVLRPPLRFRAFVREVYKLGVLSLIIVCLSSLAVGMVLGLQGYHTLVRFGAEKSLGALVGLTLIRELGPVVAALLITGRAGSATTAEIGAMVATEQLDGLRMQSIDPVHFVITPKVLAMVLSVPLLTALFIIFGLAGGYIAGVLIMGGDPGSYISSLQSQIDLTSDLGGSLIKSFVFGILLAVISTHRGYISEPTSAGVSAATTSTVVIGSVTVLIADYIITALWGV